MGSISIHCQEAIMRVKARSAVLAFAVVAGAAACGGGGSGSGNSSNGPTGNYGNTPTDNNPAPSSPNTINANPSLNYNPTTLTVSRGTTVTFVFGTVGHSVTFSTNGAPASVPVTANASVQVTFPNTGVFNFYCTVHQYMTGSITVQ
jgi:plastocyanin